METLPPKDIFSHAEILFHSVELAAREVTGSMPHQKKPSAAELKLTSLLTSGSFSPGYSRACEELVATLHEEPLSRTNKRVHASLVSGRGMKKVLQAHASISNPPIALIDGNGRMSASPQESCDIMSHTLAGLGGDMAYSVPKGVESHFLDHVPDNPPEQNFLPPSWEQFQSIVRKPKPQKAVGLDSLNLYLISVLPEVIQHWFYFLTRKVMTLDIPQNWLEAEIFLLPKGGDLFQVEGKTLNSGPIRQEFGV